MMAHVRGVTLFAHKLGAASRFPGQFPYKANGHGRTLCAPTAHVWLYVGGGVPDAPIGTRILRADMESAPTASHRIER